MKKRSENQWFLMVIQKAMKNRCQNGSQKSWQMVQNGARGRPGSIYSSFLSIFGEGEKTWFFDEVPGRPKNKENRPVERQRLEKSSPADNSTTDRSPGGSRHSRLGIKRPTTSRWSHTPKGRRPGEFVFGTSHFLHLLLFGLLSNLHVLHNRALIADSRHTGPLSKQTFLIE